MRTFNQYLESLVYNDETKPLEDLLQFVQSANFNPGDFYNALKNVENNYSHKPQIKALLIPIWSVVNNVAEKNQLKMQLFPLIQQTIQQIQGNKSLKSRVSLGDDDDDV